MSNYSTLSSPRGLTYDSSTSNLSSTLISTSIPTFPSLLQSPSRPSTPLTMLSRSPLPGKQSKPVIPKPHSPPGRLNPLMDAAPVRPASATQRLPSLPSQLVTPTKDKSKQMTPALTDKLTAKRRQDLSEKGNDTRLIRKEFATNLVSSLNQKDGFDQSKAKQTHSVGSSSSTSSTHTPPAIRTIETHTRAVPIISPNRTKSSLIADVADSTQSPLSIRTASLPTNTSVSIEDVVPDPQAHGHKEFDWENILFPYQSAVHTTVAGCSVVFPAIRSFSTSASP